MFRWMKGYPVRSLRLLCFDTFGEDLKGIGGGGSTHEELLPPLIVV